MVYIKPSVFAKIEKLIYRYHYNKIYGNMEISIKAELEKEFREKAMQSKGYKKGAFKEALEEAIEAWLIKIASQGNKKEVKKRNGM